MKDMINRLKDKYKGPLFIFMSGAMPFLDDHTDKIIMAFMMIIGIEDSSKAFAGRKKLKKGKSK